MSPMIIIHDKHTCLVFFIRAVFYWGLSEAKPHSNPIIEKVIQSKRLGTAIATAEL